VPLLAPSNLADDNRRFWFDNAFVGFGNFARTRRRHRFFARRHYYWSINGNATDVQLLREKIKKQKTAPRLVGAVFCLVF
jgi:hypothetical protein